MKVSRGFILSFESALIRLIDELRSSDIKNFKLNVMVGNNLNEVTSLCNQIRTQLREDNPEISETNINDVNAEYLRETIEVVFDNGGFNINTFDFPLSYDASQTVVFLLKKED